ncbi:tetratricopeptide repeat-containing diguanylate cyclase [Alteromonas lipotrueae]|uniref:tetratricopeptide repeat-containing diguanylate cyclase n=1 Tax=Alteromonas lipotrueae TaxID=2803814 RepID=UPI001C46EEE6|nr:diguanylate cyclase [Alteromonas lipotrueae]
MVIRSRLICLLLPFTFFIFLSSYSLVLKAAESFKGVNAQYSLAPDFETAFTLLIDVKEDVTSWSAKEQGQYFQWLGSTAGELDRLDLAEKYLSQSLQILESEPVSVHVVMALLERSFFRYLATGDPNHYCPDRYKALNIARHLDDAEHLVLALSQTAFCATSTNNFAEGLSLLNEALALEDRYSIPPSDKGVIYNALGNIYRFNGLHGKSYVYLSKALTEWEKIDDYQGVFNMHHTLTLEAIRLADFQQAQTHVNSQFALAEKSNAGPDFFFFAQFNQGHVYYAKEKYQDAYNRYRDALALKETTVETAFVNQLYYHLALSAYRIGEFSSAAEFASKYTIDNDERPVEGIIAKSLTSLLNNKPASIEKVASLLSLNTYYEDHVNSLIQKQVSIVASENDITVAQMENDILQRQLAISELQLHKKESQETNAKLKLFLAISLSFLLILVVISLVKGISRYKKIADYDHLTGVHNRRSGLRIGERMITQAKRSRETFTVIALDIDHFKVVNDTYGHDAGDVLLNAVVNTCKHTLRKHDVMVRMGGEEFLLMLPSTELTDATEIAQRVLVNIERMVVNYGQKQLQATVSLGIACTNNSSQGFKTLLKKADEALYRAKNAGRNQYKVDESYQ